MLFCTKFVYRKEVNADVVIGKDVHVENMVIDKHAKLIHSNQIIAEPEKPGYIRRGDKL